MSWSQTYSVPSIENLLEHLVSKTSVQLLKEEAERQGIKIVREEEVILDDGMYDEVCGTKVTLSDGRVFIPKLVKKYTERGNYGCDTYGYVLESENPKVEYEDFQDDQYGLTDEASLASDGELDEVGDVENDGG